MGSLIEELGRREASSRAEADGLPAVTALLIHSVSYSYRVTVMQAGVPS
jgi:hypothetical protein